MNPRLYLTRKATEQRQRCLAWIMERRCARRAPRFQPGKLWLAKLQDTPAAIARSWANGDLPAAIAQTGIAASIGLAFGCMFGLAV